MHTYSIKSICMHIHINAHALYQIHTHTTKQSHIHAHYTYIHNVYFNTTLKLTNIF